MRKPVVALLVAAIVGVVGFGVWANQPEEEKWCYPAQGFRILDDGRTVLLQGGGPDADACSGPETRPGELVLGRDCKVRADDGTVVTTLPPGSTGCG